MVRVVLSLLLAVALIGAASAAHLRAHEPSHAVLSANDGTEDHAEAECCDGVIGSKFGGSCIADAALEHGCPTGRVAEMRPLGVVDASDVRTGIRRTVPTGPPKV